MVENTKTFSVTPEASSNIEKIEYNSPVRQLVVTFKGGSKYQYNEVSVYHGEQFMKQPLYGSYGKHFYNAIDKRYTFINLKTNTVGNPTKEPFTDEQIKEAYEHYATGK